MESDDRAMAELTLEQMEAYAQLFYRSAQAVGHHQWLEMTGIMREYLKLCRAELEAGRDFRTQPIDPPLHSVAYILEKLDCMFGDAFIRKAMVVAAGDDHG